MYTWSRRSSSDNVSTYTLFISETGNMTKALVLPVRKFKCNDAKFLKGSSFVLKNYR